MPKPKPKLKTKRRIKTGYLVVLTTCSSRREANRIARSLITKRLAACVNISSTPFRSIYRWKGKLDQAAEFLLLIKTSQSRLASLQAEIKRLHSYEVPEFLALPAAAVAPAYQAWLDDSLK
jgi:periplasmic divalent cation tolerance protein